MLVALNQTIRTHAKRPFPKNGGCKIAAGNALENENKIKKWFSFKSNVTNLLMELNLDE